ncbi:MAG: glycosyl hydrolase family 28 protein, partial [Tepidisphaeraceae bacterium]
HSPRAVRFRALATALVLAAMAQAAPAQAAGTPVDPPSTVYSLTVNGVSVPVTAFTRYYDYATADLPPGKAEVRITRLDGKPIQGATVSPLKFKIPVQENGSNLQFSIDGPQYLIVDIPGSRRLTLAFDPPETDRPDRKAKWVYDVQAAPYQADATGEHSATAALQKAVHDAAADPSGHGIVYVPAGLYRMGPLSLPSHVSLYLERGSRLWCAADAEFPVDFHKDSKHHDGTWFIRTEPGAADVRIFGRGTIDGDGRAFLNRTGLLNTLVMAMNTTGFRMDGVIIRESSLWGTIIANSDHALLSHCKHFNEPGPTENDCVDVCNSSDVRVEHALGISWDDPFSSKTWAPDIDIARKWSGAFGPCRNVSFDHCLAWTCAFGFKVGAGVWRPQENISVHDGVVFNGAHGIGISHTYGTADVRGVTFDDIDIERVRGGCLGQSWLRIAIEGVAKKATHGGVFDVTVKNINVRELGRDAVLVAGMSEARQVQGVTFANIHVPGQSGPGKTPAELHLNEKPFVQGLTIQP